MSKKSFIFDNIDDSTFFQTGELIINKNSYVACYIIVKANKDSLDTINVFTGEKKRIDKQDITNKKYKRVAINTMVYRLLSKKSPLSDISKYYPDSTLDNIAKAYALQICVNVIQRRNIDDQNYDYPCIVVAAKPREDTTEKPRLTNNVVVSTNYPFSESSWNEEFRELLKDKGFKLGEKATYKTYCKNTFGNCAEQHAANNLWALQHTIKRDNFEFSKPIRPRTGEIRPYCENCCKLFNL